jgi:2,2-dialkylglycine decarboxylase (pyruvate)
MLDRAVVGRPAAVVVEPIFNAGGAIEPPPGWLKRVEQKCRERGMLLILDEEATALGRVGAWFAFQQEGVVPDIVTLGKTLGGGMPVSSLTTSRAIWEGARERGFFHSSTHAYDPLPVLAALTVLEILADERLPEQVAEKGPYLKAQLARLAEEHELIGQVRGRGFLLGVELVRNRETREPAARECEAVVRECVGRGLIVAQTGMAALKNTVKFAPPFVATRDEIDRAVSIFADSLKAVAASARS